MTKSRRNSWLPILLALFLVPLTACSEASVELSDGDRNLGSDVGIPEADLLSIKRYGKNLRRLQGFDDGGSPVPAAGLTIDVPEKKTYPTVLQLRATLGDGYQVWISERHYGIGGQLDNVSVLRGDDPFELMRVMGTNAWNYDIGPDGVMARLAEWDDRLGLDFHGVGFDWVEATFDRKPGDMLAFAREVYAFCPDVVDQGAGTIEALADEMERSDTVYLWWD